ncbi:MAG: hypothetical protein EPN25_14145 [Nitrospirae bacterium]|nr:MAG: hypothetical protein EPN25_14145 [Nitrospirota bacterium]
MPYRIWLIAGLLLLFRDMVTATAAVSYFGIGALIVGTLATVGIPQELELQFLVFGLSSVSMLVLFRKTEE